MSNAAEVYHDPVREDVEYLLERSRQHDRQLAEIRANDDSRRKFEYLLERSQEHDSQLAELCDKWLFVTNSVGRQARQVDGLTDDVRTLERTVRQLADDLRAGGDTSRAWDTRLGEVLSWISVGGAAILLSSGIWLFSAVVKTDSPEPGAWFVPAALIVASIVAALIAGVLRR